MKAPKTVMQEPTRPESQAGPGDGGLVRPMNANGGKGPATKTKFAYVACG